MKGFVTALACICMACASSSLSNFSCISDRAKPLSLIGGAGVAIKLEANNRLG